MKQSTAWVVSIFASGAIVGTILALLFNYAEQSGKLSQSPGETYAPASPSPSSPETMSPDQP